MVFSPLAVVKSVIASDWAWTVSETIVSRAARPRTLIRISMTRFLHEQVFLSQTNSLLFAIREHDRHDPGLALDVFVDVALDVRSRHAMHVLDISRVVVEAAARPPEADSVRILRGLLTPEDLVDFD